MGLGQFAQGFIAGCAVTVAALFLVFGVALFLRRKTRGGRATLTSDSYARVLEERGVEMGRKSGGGGGGFVIGDEEREEMTSLELESNPELTPQEFEANWLAFQNRHNLNFTLLFGDANIEEILSSQRIKCMACGAAGSRQKVGFRLSLSLFFFFFFFFFFLFLLCSSNSIIFSREKR